VARSQRHTHVVIRFTPSTDIAGHTPVKSSVQRAIRAAVLSQWKIEPETLEAVWPKKEGLVHVKWSVARRTLSFV
jgi:Pre-PUA-like domain